MGVVVAVVPWFIVPVVPVPVDVVPVPVVPVPVFVVCAFALRVKPAASMKPIMITFFIVELFGYQLLDIPIQNTISIELFG